MLLHIINGFVTIHSSTNIHGGQIDSKDNYRVIDSSFTQCNDKLWSFIAILVANSVICEDERAEWQLFSLFYSAFIDVAETGS